MLMDRDLIFEGTYIRKEVFVNEDGAYIRRGAYIRWVYIRDFTVSLGCVIFYFCDAAV